MIELAKEFKQPYEEQFWGNTQKYGPNSVEERYRIIGAVMGPNDELAIVRHPVDVLPKSQQTEAGIASQTGLNIIIKDERAVVALKLTDDGGGAGDVIQSIDADGAVGAKLTAAGVWTDMSAREYKENMRQIPDIQIKSFIEKLQLYTFNYLKEPGVKYASPEAGEYHELTKMGDSRTISAQSVATLALRGVQFLWDKMRDGDTSSDGELQKKVDALEKRLAKMELANDGGADKV